MSTTRGALAGIGAALLVAVAGCATSGGVAVEGAAQQVTPPPTASALPNGTPPSADAVAVLRGDQNVSVKIKQQLVPCAGGQYPVDARYADLTGDGEAELMVSVRMCADKEPAPAQRVPAYAGYVYGLASDPPARLFAVEDSLVELFAVDGGLTVLRERTAAVSDECCVTEKYTYYEWNGSAFVETRR